MPHSTTQAFIRTPICLILLVFLASLLISQRVHISAEVLYEEDIKYITCLTNQAVEFTVQEVELDYTFQKKSTFLRSFHTVSATVPLFDKWAKVLAINLEHYNMDDCKTFLNDIIVTDKFINPYLYYAYVKKIGMSGIDETIKKAHSASKRVSLPRICYLPAVSKEPERIVSEMLSAKPKELIEFVNLYAVQDGSGRGFLSAVSTPTLLKLYNLLRDKEPAKVVFGQYLLERGVVEAIESLPINMLVVSKDEKTAESSAYGLSALFADEADWKKNGYKKFTIQKQLKEMKITHLSQLPLVAFKKKDPSIEAWTTAYYDQIIKIADQYPNFNISALAFIGYDFNSEKITEQDIKYIQRFDTRPIKVIKDPILRVIDRNMVPYFDKINYPTGTLEPIAAQIARTVIPMEYCEQSLLWADPEKQAAFPNENFYAVFEIFKSDMNWIDGGYKWKAGLPECFKK